jgi:hypothetical protein
MIIIAGYTRTDANKRDSTVEAYLQQRQPEMRALAIR